MIDRGMEERIRKLESTYVSFGEQQQLESYSNEEALALKQQRKQMNSFALNSAMSIAFGSPTGAVKAVKNAYQFSKSQDRLNQIKKDSNSLNQRIQNRYKQAEDLGNKIQQQKVVNEYEY